VANIKIQPKPERALQVRDLLDGRFSRQVYQYTAYPDGSLVLHGAMKGILTDIVRGLEREGLLLG